jgi:hypothetical protein
MEQSIKNSSDDNNYENLILEFGEIDDIDMQKKVINALNNDIITDLAIDIKIPSIILEKINVIKHRIAKLISLLQYERPIDCIASVLYTDRELYWSLRIIIGTSRSVLQDVSNIDIVEKMAISIINKSGIIDKFERST